MFDSARTLFIAEVHGTEIVNSSYLHFDPGRLVEFIQLLRAHKVMVIICGAVCEGPASMLETAGFELIPFVAGNFRRVLTRYARGKSLRGEFTMPGCGKHICCQGKIRRGREIKQSPRRGQYARGQRRSQMTTERKDEDKKYGPLAPDPSARLVDET
ncbi:NifB/NifX family molybdenum-iron cluster-binding protein [Desulfobulbus alkaliphilus]|nr:NifB/NifX family molybdenum-iron cluster-binding protein [Desulfobulbus alkaliphilus]